MSYKLILWALKVFLILHVASRISALEARRRAPPADPGWKSAKADYDAVTRRQAEILRAHAAEAKPPAWGGSYSEGSSLDGMRVVLSDTAGAAVTFYGDLENFESSVGTVQPLPNGYLTIRLEHPVTMFEDGEYVPVAWAGRTYLIESDRLAGFASDINLGFEPREQRRGMYFLRDGDEKLAVTGMPALPAEDLALIRKKPLLVRVTSVRSIKSQKLVDDYVCSYRIDIDHGAADGLAKGVKLDLVSNKDWKEIALTKVWPSRASAEYEQIQSTCGKTDELPVRGELYTTGSYPAPRPKSDNEQCPKNPPQPAPAASAAHRPG